MTQREVRGLLYALGGVFLFSLSVPMTKWALESFDPIFTSTFRAVIASTMAVVLFGIKRVPRFKREHLRRYIYTTLGAAFGWPILIALALNRPHSTSVKVAVIAAIMPLITAIFAVLRARERVSQIFWIASTLGTLILILFTLSRGGGGERDLIADGLVLLAVIASAWCYVEGAELTKDYPGWVVISWVVILSLPLNLPLSIYLWFLTHHQYHMTVHGVTGMFTIGASSMYLGFFLWYKGLADAGTARGSQVQQLQALLTLGWSVLLLGERVNALTLFCAVGVVICVLWALSARESVPHNR